jgi:hypothetical protein
MVKNTSQFCGSILQPPCTQTFPVYNIPAQWAPLPSSSHHTPECGAATSEGVAKLCVAGMRVESKERCLTARMATIPVIDTAINTTRVSTHPLGLIPKRLLPAFLSDGPRRGRGESSGSISLLINSIGTNRDSQDTSRHIVGERKLHSSPSLLVGSKETFRSRRVRRHLCVPLTQRPCNQQEGRRFRRVMITRNMVFVGLVPCVLLLGCFAGSACAFSPIATMPSSMARHQMGQVCPNLAVAETPTPFFSQPRAACWR